MDKQKFNKHFRLAKIDETNHTVLGIGTAEIPDKEGEIADYKATKAAVLLWSAEFQNATANSGQEPSLGNIRLMHGLDIAGKVTKIEFKDAEKEIWIESTPKNDEMWQLVKGGYVTGYSMGGSYEKREREVIDGETFYRYEPSVSEFSYVDNPCLGIAHFTAIKANGSIELRKFKPKAVSEGDVKNETADTQSEIEKSVKKDDDAAMAAKSVEKDDADAAAKTEVEKDDAEMAAKTDAVDKDDADAAAKTEAVDKDDADAAAKADAEKKKKSDATEKAVAAIEVAKAALAHQAELKKGLYDAACLIDLINQLSFLSMQTAWERDREGDASNVPDQLRASLESLAQSLKDMVSEEVEELLDSTAVDGGLQEGGLFFMSKETTDLQKAAIAKAKKTLNDHLDKMHKSAADHCEKMCKAAETHKEDIQTTVDKIRKAVGETPDGAEANTEDEPNGDGENKADKAVVAAEIVKSAAEVELEAKVAELNKTVAELKAAGEALEKTTVKQTEIKVEEKAATTAVTKDDEVNKGSKDSKNSITKAAASDRMSDIGF